MPRTRPRHDDTTRKIALILLWFIGFGGITNGAIATNMVTITDVDIEIQLSPSTSSTAPLIIWVAADQPFQPTHQHFARLLSQQGLTVWQVDLLDALFKPYNDDELRALDGQYVAGLITYAGSTGNRRVILLGARYAAIPILRGIRRWQLTQPTQPLVQGAILVSPGTYEGLPTLGQPPKHIPIVTATNVPVLILQGEYDVTRWHTDALVELLKNGGSSVYRWMLPDLHNPLNADTSELSVLSKRLSRAMGLLQQHDVPVLAAPMTLLESKRNYGRDVGMKPYRGQSSPPPLKLVDSTGSLYQRSDYTGQITIVNFWASWCPPCVEEIPSLNNLRQTMQDMPFELVSINVAESPDTIKTFLKKVKVDFPVLLDTFGKIAKQWEVIGYPSTFVINSEGRIVYGANAAIVWDSPAVIQELRDLMSTW